VFPKRRQDNKWLRELMRRGVMPSNIVSFENQPKKHQEGRGLAIRGFVVSIFRRLTIFSKDQLAGRKLSPCRRRQ